MKTTRKIARTAVAVLATTLLTAGTVGISAPAHADTSWGFSVKGGGK